MKKSSTIIAYILLGLIPTIVMFTCHDWMCKYDMNPLCYIKCVLPVIISSPILCFNGDE